MLTRRTPKLLVVFCISILLTSCATGADRVALIIGNSSYTVGPLKNPRNDADLMSRVLRNLDFEVLSYKDLGLQQMRSVLGEYRRKLTPGGLGFFFFAGHGLQLGGQNYLAPVDVGAVAEHEVPYRMLDIGMVLEALEYSQANLNVVVLDCCRNNPLQRSWRSRQSGLAAIRDVPEGTIMAYSTAPGQLAADGKGNNSPYTLQLAKALSGRPSDGLQLVDVFLAASRAVRKQTNQRPWMHLDASMPCYFLWKGKANGINTTGVTSGLGGKLPADPPTNVVFAQPAAEPKSIKVLQHPLVGHWQRVGPDPSGLKLQTIIFGPEFVTTWRETNHEIPLLPVGRFEFAFLSIDGDLSDVECPYPIATRTHVRLPVNRTAAGTEVEDHRYTVWGNANGHFLRIGEMTYGGRPTLTRRTRPEMAFPAKLIPTTFSKVSRTRMRGGSSSDTPLLASGN